MLEKGAGEEGGLRAHREILKAGEREGAFFVQQEPGQVHRTASRRLAKVEKERSCKGPAEPSSPPIHLPACLPERAAALARQPPPLAAAAAGGARADRRFFLFRLERGAAELHGRVPGAALTSQLRDDPAAQRLLRRAASARRLEAARATPASQRPAGNAAPPAGETSPAELTEPGQGAELSHEDLRLRNGDSS